MDGCMAKPNGAWIYGCSYGELSLWTRYWLGSLSILIIKKEMRGKEENGGERRKGGT